MKKTNGLQVGFDPKTGSFRIIILGRPTRADIQSVQDELTAHAQRLGFSTFVIFASENEDGTRELRLLPGVSESSDTAGDAKVAQIETSRGNWQAKFSEVIASGAKQSAPRGVSAPKGGGASIRKRR